MQFFILVILICLLVFLYCVYLLANEDFIFLRRDVTMEKLFNIIFLGGLVSLFFARLFYGLSNATNILLNPFVFLLFPYFPGLSMVGGVFGAAVTFLFLARWENKWPLGRMSDFFSIAFLAALPVGFLGYFMFSEASFSAVKAGSLVGAYLVLFVIFLKFLLPQLLNGKLKEGTITFLFLICFSIVSLISNAFPKISVSDFFKNFENLILLVILLSSIGLLIKQEDLLLKIKQFRRKK